MSDRKSIVVLDDDPFSLQYFRELLGSDYNLMFFTEAKLALAYLETSKTDLVITDISLVGTSGYDVAKQVRSQANHQNTPFIFVSGFSSGRIGALADSFSNAAFTSKEANPEDTRGLIKSLLPTSDL